MPAWHNGLSVFLFLVLPAVFFVAYFALLGTVETKTLFLYFTFTMIHTVFVTLWFFVVLIDILEGLKMQNVADRRSAAAEDGAKGAGAAGVEEAYQDDKTVVNEVIPPGRRADSAMRFREDMYSLLFVSLVKPQYKMYCDLVAKTGQPLPNDGAAAGPLPVTALDAGGARASGGAEDGPKQQTPWIQKFKSFVCCRRPSVEEKEAWSASTNALRLGVMDAPAYK